jgi:hypothetical protein
MLARPPFEPCVRFFLASPLAGALTATVVYVDKAIRMGIGAMVALLISSPRVGPQHRA